MWATGTSWTSSSGHRRQDGSGEQKNRELADVKARYMERQRQAENYKRRVDVIDQLRASQPGRSIC